MILAQHIKDLRIEKNYTQSHLAFELNVSQKTYSNLENGKSKITLDQLQQLADVYKIEVTSFISKISQTYKKTIDAITAANTNISGAELYDGINSNLPFELINQLKARINDLQKLIDSKDERIKLLYDKIEILEA